MLWSPGNNRLKQTGEQLDDRIVEVHWDLENECWRMMRFRDDKPNGNHKSVVDNIIKSIAEGVERDQVSMIPSLPFLTLQKVIIPILSLSC